MSEHLLARNPALKVIYSSGYSPGQETKDIAVLRKGIFLAKPYRASELLEILRTVLDRTPAN